MTAQSVVQVTNDRFGGRTVSPRRRDRGVSIAVTHVLTIGITTILISGLLIAAGGLLEAQQDRSAEQSLETIGERLSGELSSVERLAADDNESTVELTVSHPSQVASERYTVTLYDNCDDAPTDAPLIAGGETCLQLESDSGTTVFVPVTVDVADGTSTSGGSILIVYDGENDEVTLEEGSR